MTRRWFGVLLGIAALGSAVYGLVSDNAGRACGSFLGGLVLAAGVFAVSTAAVDMFSKFWPALALPVAYISYVTTVGLMAALFVVVMPSVVDTTALAVGLVCAVVVGVGAQLSRAWVR